MRIIDRGDVVATGKQGRAGWPPQRLLKMVLVVHDEVAGPTHDEAGSCADHADGQRSTPLIVVVRKAGRAGTGTGCRCSNTPHV